MCLFAAFLQDMVGKVKRICHKCHPLTLGKSAGSSTSTCGEMQVQLHCRHAFVLARVVCCCQGL